MILIPAYEPDGTLVKLVDELLEMMRSTNQNVPLLVINDGSRREVALQVFADLEARGIEVVTHPVNKGKGGALKTGIAIARDRGMPYVLTADADGQHLPVDILRVMAAGVETGNSVILGRRVFDESTPLRSKFGNELTIRVFHLVHGKRVNDTQTGLRFIPACFYEDLLAITKDKYDFELAALIIFARRNRLQEVVIQTVYEPGNPSSHFRKLQDSAKIYAVLLRGGMVSLFLALMDFLTFQLVDSISGSTTLSVVVARTVGTLGYFYLARNFIYKVGGNTLSTFMKYLVLVLLNISILVPLIDLAKEQFEMPKVLTYIAGTLGLFFFNFFVQRAFIFKKVAPAPDVASTATPVPPSVETSR
ncbi:MULTISPECIES: bifunctional glycosyltransferase family 2/GtrA family protein [unclassified Pseudomonas]|uniref:bifunctional glycosyltransferase family 2/GtrA family protein n=1 Tax=unclassified Pseudomonas TaxID=196821 RepID=UPI0021CA5DD5|nr:MULTISPECIES: bifunctional glycosyltransferase family 2/GtrA family protein [unclassified Pseudomonas]MCU1733261.1 bifunctional glycosyltransferase family 2/GtrA family protein [Pseudomonas sp. 20P_3.2_Bac4]MCU1745386.1 bifunctional glycosyltransferase family 2/GtrA family protein [Pseudomonas sp. 20P_3.2_Bac5]